MLCTAAGLRPRITRGRLGCRAIHVSRALDALTRLPVAHILFAAAVGRAEARDAHLRDQITERPRPIELRTEQVRLRRLRAGRLPVVLASVVDDDVEVVATLVVSPLELIVDDIVEPSLVDVESSLVDAIEVAVEVEVEVDVASSVCPWG